MQLCCYVEIYNIPLPSSGEAFNKEFLNLIEFEILKPEGMIKAFNPEFSLNNFLQGKSQNEGESEQRSFTADSMLMIMGLVLVNAIALFFFLMKKIPRLKTLITKLVLKIKKEMIWNGIIQAVYVAFYKLLVDIEVQIMYWQQGKDLGVGTRMAVLLITFVLISVCFIHYTFVSTFKDIILSKMVTNETYHKFMEKYSNVVNDIHVHRNGLNMYHYSVFFFRRLWIVAMAMIWFKWFSVQVQVILFS